MTVSWFETPHRPFEPMEVDAGIYENSDMRERRVAFRRRCTWRSAEIVSLHWAHGRPSEVARSTWLAKIV